MFRNSWKFQVLTRLISEEPASVSDSRHVSCYNSYIVFIPVFEMKKQFEAIIQQLIGCENDDLTLCGINVPAQFNMYDGDTHSVARNLNAAFLIVLSGESHPLFSSALRYIGSLEHQKRWEQCVDFYRDGLRHIRTELSHLYDSDGDFRDRMDRLSRWVSEPEGERGNEETATMFHRFFFPEGADLRENWKAEMRRLRKKRSVNISEANSSPIMNPAKEMLFTSNILLTVPSSDRIDNPGLSETLVEMLRGREWGEQAYWYDHPVPIGISPEHNEILHGLEGFDDAVAFEKEHGTVAGQDKITCILSVSSTHASLHDLAKLYIEDELKREKNIRHLEIFVFTEADTKIMLEDILIPVAERYGIGGADLLYEIFGVDGEYGRHYSFLKAITAFWQVCIDVSVKGTFKIDLDQVFPQRELLEQTGASAFEHLKTPLWGALGTDSSGRSVELGMIAGALVNHSDIEDSLFTPDVTFSSQEIRADEFIFFSVIPQALSTQAEMMTRYDNGHLDGRNRCIQRIHVTGGTNGILIEALRRHRLFTLSVIGRAEDQAYILSKLMKPPGPFLRYLHKDGLIMRHDKDVLAGDAIKAASIGKLVGDYIRILLFTYYGRALPWDFAEIKESIDPFTGCFVCKAPLTVVYLRFALKTASFFHEDTSEKKEEGYDFMSTGCSRLHNTIKKLNREPNPLIEQYRREREGWDVYYDILDAFEEHIGKGNQFALDLKKKAASLVSKCRIRFPERG